MLHGLPEVSTNDLRMRAYSLPEFANGYFLASRSQGDTFPVNNSQGRLCLGGFIGRYVGPGQILNSGLNGAFELSIDLHAIPNPLGTVATNPGETWHFQAWHRDANPTSTSNFTNAVSITLQ